LIEHTRVHPGRLLICADLFADIGNQVIGLFLINLLVFKGDSPVFGMVMMCVIHQVPSLFLSPLAGAGVDKTGARKWLMRVNLAKCFLVGLFAYVTSQQLLFPVYLAFIVASLFFAIGRMSLAPMIVSKNRLIAFNALNERVAISGGIISPWIIGVMIEKWGQASALGAAFLLFAGSILLIAGIRVLPRKSDLPAMAPGPQKDLRDNARPWAVPIKMDSSLKPYFLLLGFVLLGGGVLNLGLPLYLKNDLNINIAEWGFIMSAFQTGAFLSTCLLPRMKTTLKQGVFLPSWFLVLAGAMFLLPHATAPVQVSALMLLLGCGFTMLHIYWETMIQQNSPRHMLAKTMALLSSYKGACYLATILCGALISVTWGAAAFIMLGSIAVGSACLFTPRVIKFNTGGLL